MWVSLAVSGCALGAFLCFWEISRCRPCFCAIWYGARCTIHTRLRMFCKGSPNQKRLAFQTLLGHPDTHERGQKRSRRAGEGPGVAPETPDSYQNGAQAPCRESVKRKKWKCQKLEGNVASEGKLLINTQENVKSESEFLVGSGRAPGRPRLSRESSGVDLG